MSYVETLGEERKVVWWRTAHGARGQGGLESCRPEPARVGHGVGAQAESRGSPSHAASRLTSGTGDEATAGQPGYCLPARLCLGRAYLAGLPSSPQPQDCLQRPDQRAQTRCGAAPWRSHGQRPRPQCQGQGRLLCGWAGLSRRSLRQRGEETPRLPRGEDRAGSSYRGDPDSRAHARGWPRPALGTLPAVRGHTTVPGPGPAEAVVGGPERPHHPVQATGGCPPRGR